MRWHIIAVLAAVILLASCAPVVEVDVAKPVEEPAGQEAGVPAQQETPIEKPEEIMAEEQAERDKAADNSIIIREDSFYPSEKTININEEVTWTKEDDRDYQIACYFEGSRVAISPSLKSGDSFSYRFLKEGEYRCLTFPYGMKNMITVKEEATPLLSPTGNAVGTGKSFRSPALAILALFSAIILALFIFGRKKD
ncbi:hypothetical protein KY358_04780 [Candidatus Woesearchaeota archaeon]|nr:hypothetical protein [Candidatus Woesearchaeota archaeon]